MTNFEWLMTLSEEEFTDWVYDQWLHHLQYRWSSSRGGLMIWLKEERAEQTEPSSSEIPNNCDEPQTYKINPKEPTNMPKCFDCEDFFTCDGQCDEIECEKCKHFREEADTYTKQCEFYFMECKYEPKDEPQTDCAWK